MPLLLPKIAADPDYLARHHMRWRGPLAPQQEAGPYSALGRLKFEMSDRFEVYLHDTPEKWRFRAANRMMSHGCVRVEKPVDLAAPGTRRDKEQDQCQEHPAHSDLPGSPLTQPTVVSLAQRRLHEEAPHVTPASARSPGQWATHVGLCT